MKNILIIFLTLLTMICEAQFFIAGSQAGYYVNINPDTTLSIPSSNTPANSYKIDVDNDNSDDFIFYLSSFWALGGNERNIYLQVINPKISLKIKRIDSVFTYCGPSNSWYKTTKVLKHYSLNDTIKEGPITSNLGYCYYFGQQCSGNYNVTDWVGLNDNYIGFTYNNGTSLDYGWIRVDISANSITIKDYCVQYSCFAFPNLLINSSSNQLCAQESATLTASGASSYTWSNGSNNSSIVITPDSTVSYTVNATTGNGCLLTSIITQSVNSCVGITEYLLNDDLKIYPNPISNTLFLSSKNNYSFYSKIEILNSLGQTVLKTEFKNQIDVSELTSGFYTLIIKDNSGSVRTKKFVKE